jgi:hypothetical protein
MDIKPENQRDEVKRQTIMWNRDILQYIVLHQATKHGDVGLMEDSLPPLLLRFIGGKNSNYATEVLELLQSLQREWSPPVKCVSESAPFKKTLALMTQQRDFVRNHCWLVNHTGKPTDFLPIDEAQEHNIKEIKVCHGIFI